MPHLRLRIEFLQTPGIEEAIFYMLQPAWCLRTPQLSLFFLHHGSPFRGTL
jgi:hypothetical protein